MYTDALRRSSLGYLNREAPINKDDGLFLSLQEELGVAICFIFKEVKKVIFKNISIFFQNIAFFFYPTDNFWGYPAKNSNGSKSFVCYRDQRIMRARRQIQCFVRLCKGILDLIEFVKHELERQPDAECSVEIKCITK